MIASEGAAAPVTRSPEASPASRNRLQPLPQVLEGVRKKFGVRVPTSTARAWLSELAPYLPFLRLRDAARFHAIPAHKAIVEHRLFHGQVYDFKYHRTKTDLLLTSDPANAKLEGLRSYLDSIPAACPHELSLKETPRASQAKNVFPVHDIRITERHDNTAVESARLALQWVAKNKLRHETLQQFMLVNDSTTVAVEVPLVLTYDDLHYYCTKLGFEVPLPLGRGDVCTGHTETVEMADMVPLSVRARLDNVEWITIVGDKNPNPIIAHVLIGDWSAGVSRHPNLSFKIRRAAPGDLIRVSWSDNAGHRGASQVTVG